MAVETFEASWSKPKPVPFEQWKSARLTVVLRMRERGYPNEDILDTLEMLGLRDIAMENSQDIQAEVRRRLEGKSSLLTPDRAVNTVVFMTLEVLAEKGLLDLDFENVPPRKGQ